MVLSKSRHVRALGLENTYPHNTDEPNDAGCGRRDKIESEESPQEVKSIYAAGECVGIDSAEIPPKGTPEEEYAEGTSQVEECAQQCSTQRY